MSLQGIKKIIKPHWTAGAVFNIHLTLSGQVEARTPVFIEGDNSDPENIILRVHYTDGTYVEYATEGRGMYITAVNCPGFMSFRESQSPGRPPVTFYYYDYTEGSVTTETALLDVM